MKKVFTKYVTTIFKVRVFLQKLHFSFVQKTIKVFIMEYNGKLIMKTIRKPRLTQFQHCFVSLWN